MSPPETRFPRPRFLDRSTPPTLLTLVLVAGVAALNQSVFLPSLDAMARHFHTSYQVMQLSVSGYLLATAALQLLVGTVADSLGRRPVMMGALAVFVGATVLMPFAPSAGAFLALRMIQAVAVAGIVLSRAVIRDTTDQAGAASRIGYVTMGMALVPMVGPMVGGALDAAFDWRASFALLAGLGALTLGLVALDQGETGRARGEGVAAQLGHWPLLLRSRRFWAYTLCAAFASGAFYALLGGASFVAGTLFGLSPLWTGVALGAPALGYFGGNLLSGRLSARVGIDRMAAWGCVVASLGMGAALALTLAGVLSPFVVFGFCVALGVGNGMTMPNAIAGAISVRPDLAGTASGLSGAILTAGGAGLAVLAAAVLSPATGPWPLLAIMAASSALAGASLLLARGT